MIDKLIEIATGISAGIAVIALLRLPFARYEVTKEEWEQMTDEEKAEVGAFPRGGSAG